MLAALVCGIQAGCKADLKPFLGTWQLAGSVSVAVGPKDAQRTYGRSSAAPFPDLRVTFSDRDGALVSRDSLGCELEWRVSGSKATSVPEQRCEARTRHATYRLQLEAGAIALRPTDPDHLQATGSVSGVLSSGGAILGTDQPASGQVDGTLIRAATSDPAPPP